MIHFLFQHFGVVSVFIGLLIGLGSSWMYLRFRLKPNVLTQTQQTLYVLGILFISAGSLLFLLMLVLNFRIYGTINDKLFLVFVTIAVLVILVIAIPSILFIKHVTRDRERI